MLRVLNGNSIMKRVLVMLAVVLSVTACSEQPAGELQKASDKKVAQSPIVLESDPSRYTQGLRLYQQTCAACHGQQGEGAVNWQRRDAQGQYKPPPLNGTGHTWHHPKQVLMDIIRNGTQRLGGNMPAWKDHLSDAQIEDILYWLQSQWPKEIYEAWYQNNEVVFRNQSMNGKK